MGGIGSLLVIVQGCSATAPDEECPSEKVEAEAGDYGVQFDRSSIYRSTGTSRNSPSTVLRCWSDQFRIALSLMTAVVQIASVDIRSRSDFRDHERDGMLRIEGDAAASSSTPFEVVE